MTKAPTRERWYAGEQGKDLRHRLMSYSRPREAISCDITRKEKERPRQGKPLNVREKVVRKPIQESFSFDNSKTRSHVMTKAPIRGRWNSGKQKNHLRHRLMPYSRPREAISCDITRKEKERPRQGKPLDVRRKITRKSSEQQEEVRKITNSWVEEVGKWDNAWAPNYVHGTLDLTNMDEVKTITREEMDADFQCEQNLVRKRNSQIL